MFEDDVLTRAPYGYHGTIPLYSKPDEYTENYERISADHLESLRSSGTNPFINEEIWVEFERSTIDLVRKYGRPNDKILDVGVGLGRVLSHFPTMRRYGVDISLGYLEIAQREGIDVCYALIEDLPYRDEVFDLIVSTDVLEHVLDLNRCCANILAALKPNGTLIVRVPYREDLSKYLVQGYPYKYVHIRNFDEFSLRLYFERVFGCRVVETSVSGYQRSPDKLKMHPRWRHVWDRLIPRVGRVHESLGDYLVKALYHPVEINVVILKQ